MQRGFRFSQILLLACTPLFICASANAQAPAAQPSTSQPPAAQSSDAKPPAATAPAANADNGKKLFVAYGCYECHGRQGQGASTAPRIGPPAIPVTLAMRYVRHPTGQMPPYTEKVVPDSALDDIFAFLKTIPPPPHASTIPLLNQ